MAGEMAKFLLRPVVKSSSGSSSPNIDLIAELKAANGRQSLKRFKRQQKVADDSSSEVGGTDSVADANDPKGFWKQLQKRPASPLSDAGSRRSSIALRTEFDPKNFLDKVTETDVLGNTIPGWKKQILARTMAEKAQTAADEQKKIEEEENKYKNLPMWKRALMEKKAKEKEEQDCNKDNAKNKENVNTDKLPMTNGDHNAKDKENSNKDKLPMTNGETKSMLETTTLANDKSPDEEKQITLKKATSKFEELDKRKSVVQPTVAPWQLELKKKKKTFTDGFV